MTSLSSTLDFRSPLRRSLRSNRRQTRSFNISPRYEFPEVFEEGIRTRKQVLIGYSVSNSASVKIRDLDAAGSIIDEVAEAGGDLIRINGISFTVEDPKPFTRDLREAAVKDAIDKASHLASLAGVSLGRLLPRFIAVVACALLGHRVQCWRPGSPGPVGKVVCLSRGGLRSDPPRSVAAPGRSLEIRMTVQAMFEIM